ncbi:MAG: NAD(P)/FAD-dependent oxidoreductase [Candidatus Aenigmarchaeota archaeon]|nr:NAD(P)/FAD-dependent oxidoreductase [Candidatus Aenigmarchaeota archaeon]
MGISRLIKIAGAGPSGLSAAINLAKAGFEVEVFEVAGECGSRFGGDLQGLENWSKEKNVIEDLKEMNIETNFDCDPFSKVNWMTASESLEFEFSKPMFYLVKRGVVKGSLDHGLKTQAIENGVRINFNSKVSEDQVDIVATGPLGKESFGVDKGIIFETDMDDMAIGLSGHKFAYKGYAYLLVTKGYGCMCTVVFDKFETVNQCLEETKKFFEKKFDMNIRNSKRVGGVATFSLKGDFQVGEKRFVGEAAGIQDLLWGFGIRNSITSGYLASKTIIENKSYQELAKEYFDSKLKASLVSRFLSEVAGDRMSLIQSLVSQKNGKVKNPDKVFDILRKKYGNYSKILYPLAVRSLRKRYKFLRD